MAKFLVLGDIHNEYKFFMDASVYAEQNDLHIISVGDVIDLTLSNLFFDPRIEVICLPKPVSSVPPLSADILILS